MNCPFPDETLKAVVSYLRRTGQTIACEEGHISRKGRPNSAVIAQACADGAVTLSVDGSLLVCGTQILTELDTLKSADALRTICGRLLQSRTSSALPPVSVSACGKHQAESNRLSLTTR